LKICGNPENVILGAILEQPMTAEDVAYDLRMYDEKAEASLDNLVDQGLAEKEGEIYRYKPTEFIARTAQRYKNLSEEKL